MSWGAILRLTSLPKRVRGWVLTPGDVVELDLGMPAGSEAGLRRSAIVVTAHRVLPGEPKVVQVVPLTRTLHRSTTEVVIDPDEGNQLVAPSSAQCQHVRSVATTRIHERTGNVGPVVLGEVRETLARAMASGRSHQEPR
jgi:mRNA interferase MazF